jgi:hypothetical protein
MSDSQDFSFSGFMPMIDTIKITKEIQMLNTEGELINAHSITIVTKDNSEYVFSISNYDLMRMTFLIPKVIGLD